MNQNIIQATYTLQFGTNTTHPRLPAATRSNEAHISKNCSPTFASVLSDGSTKTENSVAACKSTPCYQFQVSVFPQSPNKFLQFQLFAVAMWMIGDLDFLCSTARCTQPSTKHEQYAWIYIYIYIYICKIKSQIKEKEKKWNKIKYSLQALKKILPTGTKIK